jgi:hypothetical protein
MSESHPQTIEVVEPRPEPHEGLLVFISHSSKDAELARALIELLKAALGIRANHIRCSSVDGYRLPVGVNTESKLREEVNAARVVVGLITPSSLASSYVMFELGARWGAGLFLAPVLAGVKAGDLRGPLSLLNALSASSDQQLHQLLADFSEQLGLPLQNTASYLPHVTAVKASADSLPKISVAGVPTKLRSEVKKLLRFPAAISDSSEIPTLIEQLAADKSPRHLFELLMQFDEKDIREVPEIGDTLQKQRDGYYRFREQAMRVESDLISRVGRIVGVRFPQAWGIYLRYVLMRFGGMSKDAIISAGNFLNFGITWDDAERVFQSLSEDASVSSEISKLLDLHKSLTLGIKEMMPLINNNN